MNRSISSIQFFSWHTQKYTQSLKEMRCEQKRSLIYCYCCPKKCLNRPFTSSEIENASVRIFTDNRCYRLMQRNARFSTYTFRRLFLVPDLNAPLSLSRSVHIFPVLWQKVRRFYDVSSIKCNLA